MKYVYIFIAIVFVSCNWAKDKTKSAVNETGQIVAKTGAEFVEGISKGVQQTFENDVILSDRLKNDGVETGKIVIRGTDSTTDNVVTAYLIFNQNFHHHVRVKIISEAGKEYGRVTQHVAGAAGEAKYIDFVFDPRTNIDSKGKLIFDKAD